MKRIIFLLLFASHLLVQAQVKKSYREYYECDLESQINTSWPNSALIYTKENGGKTWILLSGVPTQVTGTPFVSDSERSNWNAGYTHSQALHAPSNAQKNSDITKAEIEAKLIGEITTHTHPGGGSSPITASLAADHAISSTTATEVACGATALPAGTYVFTYYIIAQSATTTVAPQFGINFTGTAAVRKFTLRYPSTGTAANTGVADDVGAALTGQIHESNPQTAFSTTAPNLTHTGVATVNVDILYTIEGIMIVTAVGDLELWHGSETASSTTVKAGTSLVLTKTN